MRDSCCGEQPLREQNSDTNSAVCHEYVCGLRQQRYPLKITNKKRHQLVTVHISGGIVVLLRYDTIPVAS